MEQNSSDPELTAETVLGWFKEHRKAPPSFACCSAIAARLSPWDSKRQPMAAADVAKLLSIGEGLPLWDFKRIGNCADDLLGHLPMIIETWDSLSYPDDEIIRIRADLKVLRDTLERTRDAIRYPWGKYEPNRRHSSKAWHVPARIFRSVILEECKNDGIELIGNNRNNVLVAIIAKALVHSGYKGATLSAISKYIQRFDEKLGHAV